MTAAPQYDARKMTPEAYLAFDQASDLRHEYVDGYTVTMGGASENHIFIVGATTVALGIAIRGGTCRVAPNDARVGVPGGNYRYPDVTVVCGEARFERGPGNATILRNPTVLVEVLSPSTERVDTVDKAWEYHQIPSVQDYLIIAQDRPHLLHYQRAEAGWLLTQFVGLDATLRLDSLACTLALADVYAQVTFGEED